MVRPGGRRFNRWNHGGVDFGKLVDMGRLTTTGDKMTEKYYLCRNPLCDRGFYARSPRFYCQDKCKELGESITDSLRSHGILQLQVGVRIFDLVPNDSAVTPEEREDLIKRIRKEEDE